MGKIEIVPAEQPAIVRVQLTYESRPVQIDFEEDEVYKPGWMDTDVLIEVMSRTAVEQAHERARGIRLNGIRVGSTHYPVHRIHKVEVVPCKWTTEEATVTITKDALEPKW